MGVAYTTTGVEITNTAGGTFIDGVGIRGTTAFDTYLANAVDESASGTAFSNTTNGSVTINLTRPVGHKLWVSFNALGSAPSGQILGVSLAEWFNGTLQGNNLLYELAIDTTSLSVSSWSRHLSRGAGTYTYGIRKRMISGAGTGFISDATAYLTVLG